MPKPITSITFKAKISRPAEPKGAAWTFVVLPAAASKQLPTRSMVTVDGTLEGQHFHVTLEPDGQGSHWFKVEKKLSEAAGVATGDTVAFEMTPVEKEPEPKVPADLKLALAANAPAKATWADIAPVARRDWIHWITSGKKAETRVKRIDTALDKLACGNRRACCGMYSKSNMGAPEAVE